MITLDQVIGLYSASVFGDYAKMRDLLGDNPDPELLALPFVIRAADDCEKQIPILLARVEAMRELISTINCKG